MKTCRQKLAALSSFPFTTTLAPAMLIMVGGCNGPSQRPFQPNYQSGIVASLAADTPALPEIVPTSDVDAYITYALLNNPGLKAAFQDYTASLERVPQVTALPDPRLSYRHYVQEVQTRVGPQELAVGLSQTLPWFGKLKLQGNTASSKASAAHERLEAKRNDLVAEVADAYLEYYHLGRAIAVVRGNRDLILHLERVARTRYGAGASSHPDIIRAQVELGTLENQLASLEDRSTPLVARLNASLSRPQATPIPFPSEVVVRSVEAEDEEIFSWIAARNPELRALQFEVDAAQSATERAEKDFYPDLTFGLDYIFTGDAEMSGVDGSGDDAVIAGLSLNLPIYRDNYRAAVRESEARRKSVTLRRHDLLNRLQAEAASALFRLRDAERQIDLYQDALLPKAHELLRTTQSAYSAGDATFTDLVEAQRVLLSFELSFERSRTDHGQWRVALERLVGTDLPSTATPESTKEFGNDTDN